MARAYRPFCITITIPKDTIVTLRAWKRPYKFVDVEQLIADFIADIARVTGEDP
jgi:hypothetical protein